MSFTLDRCRVYIGYFAAAAFAAALLLDSGGRIAMCFAAALLHEAGHIVMMRAFGVRVRAVSVRLFDVLIEADEPGGLIPAVCVTAAGPAVNLILAAIFAPFGSLFGYSNLYMGLFNALPVMSLDGGRLLYLLLSRRFSPRVCARALQLTTFVFILPLMTAGLYILLSSGYNYSLLAVSLYLLAVLLLKK